IAADIPSSPSPSRCAHGLVWELNKSLWVHERPSGGSRQRNFADVWTGLRNRRRGRRVVLASALRICRDPRRQHLQGRGLRHHALRARGRARAAHHAVRQPRGAGRVRGRVAGGAEPPAGGADARGVTSAGRTGGAPALVALPIRAPTPRTLMALAAAALAALAVAGVAYWPHPAPTPRRPHEPIAHRMTVEQYAQALWNQSHPPLLRDGPLSQNGVVATPGLAPGARALTPAQALALNAAITFSGAPNPPAAPFRLAAGAEDRQRALTCLTQAVYYEAGFQPLAGEEAVAQVVLNRLRHPAFPKTVCGVVYDGSQRPTGCQFTFTCDGSLAKTP